MISVQVTVIQSVFRGRVARRDTNTRKSKRDSALAADAAEARALWEDERHLDGSGGQTDAARLLQKWYRGFRTRQQTGLRIRQLTIPQHLLAERERAANTMRAVFKQYLAVRDVEWRLFQQAAA